MVLVLNKAEWAMLDSLLVSGLEQAAVGGIRY